MGNREGKQLKLSDHNKQCINKSSVAADVFVKTRVIFVYSKSVLYSLTVATTRTVMKCVEKWTSNL